MIEKPLMRTLISCIIYMLTLPFFVAWVSNDDVGEYPLSLWICVFEIAFIILALRQNWVVRIAVGLIAGVTFPIASEFFAEILFDKGEGPLKMFSIDLIAYFFLYFKTLLLLVVIERIGNKREIASGRK